MIFRSRTPLFIAVTLFFIFGFVVFASGFLSLPEFFKDLRDNSFGGAIQEGQIKEILGTVVGLASVKDETVATIESYQNEHGSRFTVELMAAKDALEITGKNALPAGSLRVGMRVLARYALDAKGKSRARSFRAVEEKPSLMSFGQQQ